MTIRIGEVVTNDRIVSEFLCSPQSGMRRSLRTNTLVLIGDQTEPPERNPYADRWQNGVLHYTGMGLNGDQSICKTQNRTLNETSSLGIGFGSTFTVTNTVTVHLFEKREKQRYTYKGVVELAATPFQEEQPDSEGHRRLVWVFPLKEVEP